GPSGTSLDVGPTVVFTKAERVAYRRRDRVGEAARQSDLRITGRMEKPLDACLCAKGAGVPRGAQIAERQNVRVQWIENVQLQPGGKAPVVVFQLRVRLDGQKAPQVFNERAVVEIRDDHGAGLKGTDFGTRDQEEQRGLPTRRVKRVLMKTANRSRSQ